jgi:hypothetical protein
LDGSLPLNDFHNKSEYSRNLLRFPSRIEIAKQSATDSKSYTERNGVQRHFKESKTLFDGIFQESPFISSQRLFTTPEISGLNESPRDHSEVNEGSCSCKTMEKDNIIRCERSESSRVSNRRTNDVSIDTSTNEPINPKDIVNNVSQSNNSQKIRKITFNFNGLSITKTMNNSNNSFDNSIKESYANSSLINNTHHSNNFEINNSCFLQSPNTINGLSPYTKLIDLEFHQMGTLIGIQNSIKVIPNKCINSIQSYMITLLENIIESPNNLLNHKKLLLLPTILLTSLPLENKERVKTIRHRLQVLMNDDWDLYISIFSNSV